MSSYTVQSGDTLENLARRFYGDEANADLLLESNPGLELVLDGRGTAAPTLPTGAEIVVPAVPQYPKLKPFVIESNSPRELALRVDGVRHRGWTQVEVTRSLDNFDQFAFGGPFESERIDFRERFEPMRFRDAGLTLDDQPLLTGTLVGSTPSLAGSNKISAGGYARPGVLEDVSASSSSYPIEFNDVTLEAIARKLARPFGIGVVFTTDPGPAFERVALEETKRIAPFLKDLTRQRGLVMTNTRDGDLLFQKGPDVSCSDVVERFDEGSPLVSITPAFNPKRFYSHVTAIVPAQPGSLGSRYTVQNPYLRGVSRPFTFNAEDTYGGDAKTAAEARLGQMLAATVTYNVSLGSWFSRDGVLFEPGQVVCVTAPGAMVYRETKLLVRSVVLRRESAKDTCELELTLPGAFGGTLPERLPWAA